MRQSEIYHRGYRVDRCEVLWRNAFGMRQSEIYHRGYRVDRCEVLWRYAFGMRRWKKWVRETARVRYTSGTETVSGNGFVGARPCGRPIIIEVTSLYMWAFMEVCLWHEAVGKMSARNRMVARVFRDRPTWESTMARLQNYRIKELQN
jgi:hypothetical protein